MDKIEYIRENEADKIFCCLVKIDRNTKKNPGNLRRLAVIRLQKTIIGCRCEKLAYQYQGMIGMKREFTGIFAKIKIWLCCQM